MKTPKMHNGKALLLSKTIISNFAPYNIKYSNANTPKESQFICDSTVEPICRGVVKNIHAQKLKENI
ncbi:hypothetical protein [Chitinophaga sp. LS1]|uniref:hypothetical protein n=1 Tax=Chitinophaga sp. LS1 TaxID=3051176 RepID=UPI002AAB5A63|nr:hypothetical protein [Chitinophaga sp. LS1]WPV67536.1 hypothetical protein QQL36_02200 [Chitinophaga sp. LS1]